MRQIPHIIYSRVWAVTNSFKFKLNECLTLITHDAFLLPNYTPRLVYKLVRSYLTSRWAGPRSASAFLRSQENLWRAWGSVCCLKWEGAALKMSLDTLPRPFLFFFFFFSQFKTYFVAGKETLAQKCWYWRPTRKLLEINQPIRRRTKLKSRLNYSCFQVSNRSVYFQLS